MKKRKRHRSSASRGIKDWPEGERPRERLFKKGEHLLTNAELLAIIFGSGERGINAVELSRRVMVYFKTFRNMSHTDISDWKRFKGIGPAKLARLRACFEIARRFMTEERADLTSIGCSGDVASLLLPRMRDIKREIFKLLLLDSKNRVIDIVEIEEGSVDNATPNIREAVARALQSFTVSIIAVHNHPSGEPEPSEEDALFTEKLKVALGVVEISLLDHIIIGDNKFYSFADNARL
jgi:DNA repair protein RadC